MPIVSITSGKYSNAEDIVKTLSRELGYKVIGDDDILEEVKRVHGIKPTVQLKVIDNKPIAFNDFIHTREKCIACLKKTIAEYVSSGKCIFHGLLGHLIPVQTSHVLKVLIIANKKTRTKIGIRNYGLSEKEVVKNIREADKRAFLWTNGLFGKKTWHKSLYDIVIPSDKFDVNRATKLILEHLKIIEEISEETIKQEARDFALNAKIETALSSLGEGLIISTKRGDVLITINKKVLMLSKYKQKITAIVNSIEGVKSVKIKTGEKYHFNIIYKYEFETPTRILLKDEEKDFFLALSERIKNACIQDKIYFRKTEIDPVDEKRNHILPRQSILS